MIGKGVAQVSIPKVDSLIVEYVKIRDSRMNLTTKEVAAKQAVVDALHQFANEIGQDKQGTIVYRYDDLLITLKVGKADLKIRAIHEDED